MGNKGNKGNKGTTRSDFRSAFRLGEGELASRRRRIDEVQALKGHVLVVWTDVQLHYHYFLVMVLYI
jgi:hypothetical protein